MEPPREGGTKVCINGLGRITKMAAMPIAKFYVEPPWEGGTKVYINGPGHMTKMAAMPIYGKILKKSSPEPAGRFLRN